MKWNIHYNIYGAIMIRSSEQNRAYRLGVIGCNGDAYMPEEALNTADSENFQASLIN